jgi:hypothetical protein
VPQSGLQYPWQHLLICRDDQPRHQCRYDTQYLRKTIQRNNCPKTTVAQ